MAFVHDCAPRSRADLAGVIDTPHPHGSPDAQREALNTLKIEPMPALFARISCEVDAMIRRTVICTISALFPIIPAFAQTPPTAAEWSGQVQCRATIQSNGYTHEETQTWKLTGEAPTTAGAIPVYPASWSVTGQGTVQRTVGPQVIAGSWNTNVAPTNARIAIFVRASDNRLVIKTFHSQLSAPGAVTGRRQTTVTGAAPTQSAVQAAATEWTFPTIEDSPTSTNVTGSSTVVIPGSVLPMQAPTANGTANCTWQFNKGSGGLGQPTAAASIGRVSTTPVAQPTNEPSWPQKFEVVRGEHASVAFAASQPGPISVAVQSQGAPITVRLSGPIAQPIEKSGTGSLMLEYNATASDVARGSLWEIEIRQQGAPVAVAPPTQLLIVDQNQIRTPLATRLPVVTSGTVSVTHPAGDVNRLKTELAARVAAAKAAAAQTGITGQQLLDQRKTQYLQAVAAAQTSQQQKIATQRPAMVSARTLTIPQGVSTQTASGTPPPPPPPSLAITSLSVAQGQPGDTVAITGSGFGENLCALQVHFVVNPKMDLPVNLHYNSYYYCYNGPIGDTLWVQIPDFSGVLAYDGEIYVTRAEEKTASLKFHFNPALDFVQLAPPCNGPDSKISTIDFQCPYFEPPSWDYLITVHNGAGLFDPLTGDFLGHKAEDEFFVSTVLKNGWVVDSVAIKCASYKGCVTESAGAYVLLSLVGSPSPYVGVHWWTDAFSIVEYQIYVNIKGPKGVPYQ
jgi:hypothetical protein